VVEVQPLVELTVPTKVLVLSELVPTDRSYSTKQR
jgi:hypothetical protein